MSSEDLWTYLMDEKNAEIRRHQSHIQYGKLLVRSFGPNITLAYELLIDKIDIGSPTAINSDKCLAEVLNSMRGRCTLSSWCVQEVMSIDRASHGYHLTHKLMYAMFVQMWNCTSALPPWVFISNSITSICRDILYESLIIYEMHFPAELRDLLIEQVFLCGLNGYAEFLDQKWLQNIMAWQQPRTGCFSYYNSQRKRSSIRLENNCSDHMSGLALAAFTNFLFYSYE